MGDRLTPPVRSIYLFPARIVSLAAPLCDESCVRVSVRAADWQYRGAEQHTRRLSARPGPAATIESSSNCAQSQRDDE